MKVFFNALVVHLVLNVYVYIRGRQLLPPKKSYRMPYTAFFIVELLIYLIGLIGNVNLPHELLKPILLIGTSWMVLIGYLTALLLIFDGVKWLGRWNRKIKQWQMERLSLRRSYFIQSIVVV